MSPSKNWLTMMAFQKQHQSIWCNTFRDFIQSCIDAIKLIPFEQIFFLNNLKTGLSDQQKKHLQIDLSEHKIKTAINQMAKGKASDPDELSVEFYTQCWPIVKNDFVSILKQMYSTQTIDNKPNLDLSL